MARLLPTAFLEQTDTRKANDGTSPANHRNSVFSEGTDSAIYKLLVATAKAVTNTQNEFKAGMAATIAATFDTKTPSASI